jgi:hypothetical protein
MPIAPIQTTYKGYRFRSRLEARWAVFFTALGLTWEYEPEGFVLPSGQHYLPDFRVYMDGTINWFEIKPGKQPEVAKFTEFMKAVPNEVRGAVLNDIPDPTFVQATDGEYYPADRNDYSMTDCPYVLWGSDGSDDPWAGGWDNYYKFCICEGCGAVGFQFGGRSHRIKCSCKPVPGCDRGENPAHPRIIAAFVKARSACFEHDEREKW